MKQIPNLYKAIVVSLVILSACSQAPEQKAEQFDFYQSDFFKEVQLSGIFPDSKTFVDCTPKQPLAEINTIYEAQKTEEGFVLKDFVLEHFELPVTPVTGFKSDTSMTVVKHCTDLWSVLTRQPDEYNPLSSLVPLPESYIVPGGRFREIYYWDSYFTMEGLVKSGQEDMARNMVNNFSFLIDSLGFIPNGNRNYYSGRSQPPFYSLMVDLVASGQRELFMSYLPRLLEEYNFWMDGADTLNSNYPAHRRVVLMPDGSLLNRYWDNYALPRPESFKPDYELVTEHDLQQETAYRHLRAGAESGWDYSSRWFEDQKSLKTIHTTDIIPVDLNTLLYFLELKIAQGYNWKGDLQNADLFINKAEKRKLAIDKYLWDEADRFYIDYDYTKQQKTGVLSLAGAYPLFFKIASKAQAKSVVERLLADFLKPGGFVTTLNETGQQWDAPNGWAPLQWITINGLYNYGYGDEGNGAAERWLNRNTEVYKATGKMMEKYNVLDTMLLAGGGEYPLQDGFGWTNGVAIALQKILADRDTINTMRGAEPVEMNN
ncbi:alpha,alpha-trehalase TreF [Fulvivirga sp. 29W222]|uniref:Alpha,alpha-trehalase TreF n=1 Tax=Fulvivirga marina TaxID=2494733 RepID=A0A937KG68_9BACT|nr:alpha,alpha-trehalase TreF [Fulvivirga marina]MBL6449075.1 alpha,alpha-trehalase TreF [Fulvivirga marina]